MDSLVKSNQNQLRRMKHINLMISLSVSLIVILLLCTVWLIYFHVKHKSPNIGGFHEFFCSNTNITCQNLLCPTGSNK